jgi:hypothetical protein
MNIKPDQHYPNPDRGIRFVRRDYSALARSMNERSWNVKPSLTLRCSDLVERATVAFEDSADRSQARWLQERRDRLVQNINETIYLPGLFWRHRYFRHLTGGVVLSTDEAVTELKREIIREKRRKGHWSHKPHRIPDMQEALVFARFFRRFSKQAWNYDARQWADEREMEDA